MSNNENNFFAYLTSIGYRIYDNRWWETKDRSSNFVEIKELPTSWSMHSRTDIYFKKDNDESKTIVYGICCGLCIERAATIRHPLPFDSPDYMASEYMPEIFQKYTPEEIYQAMFSENKISVNE